jgi:hypothetical protein
MEHLIRPAQRAFKRLGAQNITEKQLNAIGSSLIPLHDAARAFDTRAGITRPSATRSGARTRSKVDEDMMLRILLSVVNINTE